MISSPPLPKTSWAGEIPSVSATACGERGRAAVGVEMDARGLAADRLDREGDGPTGFSLADSRSTGWPSSAASASSGGGTTYGIDLREDRAPAGRHGGRSVPSISGPTGRRGPPAQAERAAGAAPRGGPPAGIGCGP